jgi:phospholipid/cholesterol/gamma-HCH transport system substrate-binding protein
MMNESPDNLMKQRFKFRHVNEITGIFVILVMVVLIAAIVWTGYRQRWFRGTVTLRIVLPEGGAAGIRQGSEVYFLGTLVGTVSNVIVDAGGRMEAGTSIRSDFFRFVREDSFAVVKKKFGVAGDAYFEITRGQGQPLPKKDASIICKELPGTMEDAIEEVRSAVLPVLAKLSVGFDTWTTLGEKLGSGADAWTKLGTNLGESRQRLDQLFARLDGLVAGVEQGKGTAGKLLTDPTLANDLETLLDKGNASMDQLQAILKDVQAAGTHLSAVSEALAGEAEDLPGLVLQTQQTLYELERLIEGIERIWPIRSHIEQRQPNTRIPPSEVMP